MEELRFQHEEAGFVEGEWDENGLRKALLNVKNRKKLLRLMHIATELMHAIGTDAYNDFNVFARAVDSELKARKYSLSASEKKMILDVVSWYDAEAEKVIKRVHKLKGDQLSALLDQPGCIGNGGRPTKSQSERSPRRG